MRRYLLLYSSMVMPSLYQHVSYSCFNRVQHFTKFMKEDILLMAKLVGKL